MRHFVLKTGLLSLLLLLCHSITLYASVEEKELYATDFTDWTDTKAATEVSTVSKSTKYSHETLTFSLYDTQICSTNQNTPRFPDWKGGYLMCSKSGDPYVTTSALASITKVHFLHGATGSKRGWKLECKGDGDTDWVVLSDAVASNAVGTEVDVNVNRTNVQLRFTNLNASQNAYLFELTIYGNVDMGSSPILDSFKANGTAYTVADIFTEKDETTQTATIEVSKTAQMISASNPLTAVTAANGTVGTIAYEMNDTECTATIPVTFGERTVNYVVSFVWKPDFTLTYYDVDGTTLLGTQLVEKDAAIGAFAIADEKVTVADGKKFRGWSVSTKQGKQKYDKETVITADATLYALVTDIETANASSRYEYDLNNQYFYADDHEAFNVSGSGKFHNATHGWSFGSSDKIEILMGGKGYIKLGLCQYSNSGNITLTSPSGTVVGTVNAKATKDGNSSILQNTSDESGTYTLTFAGTTYLHNLTIVNMQTPAFTQEGNWYFVKPGDADSFLTALETATSNNSSASCARTYIYLPNGTYDLGNKCLTNISGYNISLVGESMDKTIIVNTPEAEGIGITATLFNTSSDLYMQDLTLKNAYPFDQTTGRAVCLQDKGTRTIAKNVRMLSYQDTYYSNNNSGKYYWETSDLHGIVDFLCGGGDVFYNKCTLTLEPGKGAYITAPYTDGTKYGYVFDGCKIVDLEENKEFTFGRSWGGTARCAFLNTVLDATAAKKISKTRWTLGGMNVVAKNFFEYNTLDENGVVISPESHTPTFTKDKETSTYETILTADSAKTFTIKNIFGTWTPDELAKQVSVSNVKLADGKLSWTANDAAILYAVYADDELVGTTTETSLVVDAQNVKTFSVRAANSMGGFGEAASANASTGISQIASADAVSSVSYSLDGRQQDATKSGISIRKVTYADGTTVARKVVK